MHNKGIYYKGNVYNIWHLDEFFKVRWISTLMIQLHTSNCSIFSIPVFPYFLNSTLEFSIAKSTFISILEIGYLIISFNCV